jgi:tetraacyldisaccharide 4'-kinase
MNVNVVRFFLEKLFNSLWYEKQHLFLNKLLLPLEYFYRYIFQRIWRKSYIKRIHTLPVPVVVIGNLVVGGSGKTPVTQALALALHAKGIRVGIVSRGYGGTIQQATLVNSNLPNQFGDEPCLLAQTTQAPVVVAKHRRDAVLLLCQLSDPHQPIQLVLSDDGMQHAALHRDFEVCVIGARGLGNQHCLPRGPLREPIERLDTVDAILNWQQPSGLLFNHPCVWSIQGTHGQLQLLNGAVAPEMDLSHLVDLQRNNQLSTVEVVAGLANPSNFYKTLNTAGLHFKVINIPDHGSLTATQLVNISPTALLLVTEKDAVKLRCNIHLSDDLANRIRVLPWRVRLPSELIEKIANLVLKNNNV